MAKGLIQHIAEDLKGYARKVLIVENNDQFLFRPDVINALKAYGLEVVQGTRIQQRMQYELREEDTLMVLLSHDKNDYLEDIKREAFSIDFHITSYLSGYHIPGVIELDLSELDVLYLKKPLTSLNRRETTAFIQKIREDSANRQLASFNLDECIETLNARLQDEIINWSVICRIISDGILRTIGTSELDEMLVHVHRANKIFQDTLTTSYQQTKNANAVKKPRIVSRILDYLDFNFRDERIALVVIDGLAYWQYELLKDVLPLNKNEDVIYSWLPSITQLSRQAIFRGSKPKIDYRQGPVSEEKLWKNYWTSKGIKAHEIRYNHETVDLSRINSVTKYAIVFKDLDEKMHSSTDYRDLLDLTENWIERSNISSIIQKLKDEGFTIFVTTDHGNIQAKGWRGLKGREKLGTNKSGSRSERHIEYSDKWLWEEFLENNPELEDRIVSDDQSIFFTGDLSFSGKDILVTHGGSHILEVLIPFIEIMNE